jgi:anti-anti-sigma factor
MYCPCAEGRFAMAANPVAPGPALALQTEKTPTETVVRCSGRINSDTSPLLSSTSRNLMLESKVLVLDLTNVGYMDSSGLGAIMGLYVSSKRSGCKLKLINLNQRIKELFSITRLAPLFEGHEDMLGMTAD